jgi:hypothetical protein
VNAAPAVPDDPSSTSPGRRSLRGQVHLIPAIVLVLATFVWMVTYGTWDLTRRETFGQFYDGQAHSLLDGQWDVDPLYIDFEAFVRDGKTYGYFGFVPALFRVPIEFLFPDFAFSMTGRWSRLSETIACCVTLWYAYHILRRARTAFPELDDPLTDPKDRGNGARDKDAEVIFLVLAGLGSTLIFLASRSYVYHEAIIWGAAFALGCYYHLLQYLARPRLGNLVAACVLAFCAFFSRASVGTGAVVALVLLAMDLLWKAIRFRASSQRVGSASADAFAQSGRKASAEADPTRRNARPSRRRAKAPDERKKLSILEGSTRQSAIRNPQSAIAHALILFLAVAAISATFVAVNYAKFRTYFEAAPLRMYQEFQRHPQRLVRTEGKLMSLRYLRSWACSYLSPGRIEFDRSFPWVYTTTSFYLFPEAADHYDLVEPYASLPATTPVLFGLTLVGMVAARRRLAPGAGRGLIPVTGALIGGLTVLAADAMSERYLHDFYPLLIVAGAFGLHALRALPVRRPRLRVPVRVLIVGVIVPAAVFSVCANVAISLYYQRMYVWGVPVERREDFRWIQKGVDEYVSDRIFGEPPVRKPPEMRPVKPP